MSTVVQLKPKTRRPLPDLSKLGERERQARWAEIARVELARELFCAANLVGGGSGASEWPDTLRWAGYLALDLTQLLQRLQTELFQSGAANTLPVNLLDDLDRLLREAEGAGA